MHHHHHKTIVIIIIITPPSSPPPPRRHHHRHHNHDPQGCVGLSCSADTTRRKNAKPRPTLDAFDDLDVDLAHGIEYMDTEEAVNEKGGSTVSTVRPERVSTTGATINTVDPEISVVEPRTPPITTSIFDDKDVTMAQKLIKMKEKKAKEKRSGI
ncbi:hypothetical protein Tco_1570068 [Tanacetum coccineum]